MNKELVQGFGVPTCKPALMEQRQGESQVAGYCGLYNETRLKEKTPNFLKLQRCEPVVQTGLRGPDEQTV